MHFTDLKALYEAQKLQYLNEMQNELLLFDQIIQVLHKVDLETDTYAASLGLVWGRD